MLVMTASPEHEPEESTPTGPVPGTRPLSRFAERFRIPLGILVALLGAALAVVFAVRPLDGDTGSRGLLTQGAGVALWLCVVGVGVTWALDTSRKVTNLCALAGIVCYGVFLVSGLSSRA